MQCVRCVQVYQVCAVYQVCVVYQVCAVCSGVSGMCQVCQVCAVCPGMSGVPGGVCSVFRCARCVRCARRCVQVCQVCVVCSGVCSVFRCARCARCFPGELPAVLQLLHRSPAGLSCRGCLDMAVLPWLPLLPQLLLRVAGTPQPWSSGFASPAPQTPAPGCDHSFHRAPRALGCLHPAQGAAIPSQVTHHGQCADGNCGMLSLSVLGSQ